MNTLKKTVVLILCLVMLALSCPTVFAANTAAISMSSISAMPTDTVAIDINMQNNPGIMGMAFSVTYDKDAFEYDGYNDGWLTGMTVKDHPDKGHIIFVYVANADKTNTGKMLSVNFKIKETAAAGKHIINLANSNREEYGNKLHNSFSNSVQEFIVPTVKSGSITVGETCINSGHKFGDWSVTKPATCTEKGSETRECVRDNCSETETREIDLLDHIYGDWVITNPATCTEKGTKESTCQNCTDKQTDEIDALNHDFEEPVVTKAPTCTENGIEEGKCKNCEQTTTNVLEAIGHNYGEWSVTKPATCTKKGVEEIVCSNCGDKKTRELDVINHDFEEPVITKKPTCTESGIEEGKCKICGQTTTNVLEAIGHNYGEWSVTKPASCTEKGIEEIACSNCGDKKTRELDALKHNFENPKITKAPTCTESGIEEGKCKNCSQKTSNIIAATGHKYGEWKVIKPASCTESGLNEHQCKNCSQTETVTVSKLGHDFEEPKVIKQATISNTGLIEGKCKRCNEVTQEITPCQTKDEATGTAFKTNEGVFAKGTKIVVEAAGTENKIYQRVKNALIEISEKFTAYDITALLDGENVQPNGDVLATFEIPKDYSQNIAIYFIANDGTAELVESTVNPDGKTVSARLKHFSVYAIVDLERDTAYTETTPVDIGDAVSNDSAAKQTTKLNYSQIITIVVCAVISLSIIAIGIYLIIKGKKQQ